MIDLPVGSKDLQQCADAVMRFRASWLYSLGRYEEIRFSDNNGRTYVCPPSPDSADFERYLQTVYSYCGTISLAQQLRSVKRFSGVQPGDVLIRGGSPGHSPWYDAQQVNHLISTPEWNFYKHELKRW